MSSFLLGPYRASAMRALLPDGAEASLRESLDDKAKLFRGLADPTRLTILQRLAHRPMSVREVARAINESVVGAGAHLACLEACGLIRRVEREGERRYAVRETVVQLIGAADAVFTAAGSDLRACSRYSE